MTDVQSCAPPPQNTSMLNDFQTFLENNPGRLSKIMIFNLLGSVFIIIFKLSTSFIFTLNELNTVTTTIRY